MMVKVLSIAFVAALACEASADASKLRLRSRAHRPATSPDTGAVAAAAPEVAPGTSSWCRSVADARAQVEAALHITYDCRGMQPASMAIVAQVHDLSIAEPIPASIEMY